ncbi:MAG: NAD(P)-binding domain-containing protein [Candidatus Competibacteraceae bacterium]|nr:NAD(P)-binding domain-containing protein [Candidatus Competibacteraceae bacterium]HRY14717.1 NAD(P)-binding domain-containing protein [Candidatus Competibacteraceae bacterium]
MELGLIGLGKMGAPMTRRLLQNGHTVWVYDIDSAKTDELARLSARSAETLANLVSCLQTPRIVWVMLPAGAMTEATLLDLLDLLEPGDLVLQLI